MKSHSKEHPKRWLIPVVIVLTLVAGGLATMKLQPDKDMDKVYDLYTIAGAIQQYYEQDGSDGYNQGLPSSIAELGNLKLRGNIGDYEYVLPEPNPAEGYEYQLCTAFEKHGKPHDPEGYIDYFDHSPGRNCYTHDAYGTNLTHAKYGPRETYPEELR